MLKPATTWFAQRGWDVSPFQRAAWEAFLAGKDGLIHSPTGSGKTLAAIVGPLLERLADPESSEDTDPIRVIWITPLRALASDTAAALREAVESLGVPFSVALRTGDTSSAEKTKQRKKLPSILVTTPESLTLLLTHQEVLEQFKGLRAVVCDEWHELLASKRGVQTDLALSRLRNLAPKLRVWGVSATLGNVQEAAQALVGPDRPPPELVRGTAEKTIEVECLLPEKVERLAWSGHIGVRLVPLVLERIRQATSTIIFTNTRAQAEIWYRALVLAAPDLLTEIALHHGSLERELRDRVESMLKGEDGGLRCVVSTSSLDLGVDFSPVDQVIQIGSPKGVARLLQRAGRSGHQPGAVSRILGVPTHAMEILEFAAARAAIERGELESRTPLDKPLDVLVQHLVTAAMADGFREEELKAEVRGSWCYRNLTDDEWRWAMQFVRHGGDALSVYPEFSRIASKDERYEVTSKLIARRHRMNIGTITADDAVAVAYRTGKRLGFIEETFISRLRPGDRFVFAGKMLRFKRVREMTAIVEKVSGTRGVVPRWNGGRMPLSTQLARSVQEELSACASGDWSTQERRSLQPLLELQAERSQIPTPTCLLLEHLVRDRRHYVFLFPYAGRLAHEGLGAVLSLRLARQSPRSVQAVVNDDGIKLSCDEPLELDESTWRQLLNPEGLLPDLLESMNAAEFSRRRFRDIARVAGLTQQGMPGAKQKSRHLQASSDMFYDVFHEFDPGNLLLEQAQREVLNEQLEFERIQLALERIQGQTMAIVALEKLSPLSFPLFAESLRATTVSTQTWEQRVRRLSEMMEQE